jgi:two-component system, NarL family, nitrate/nitrite response regulator NarL
MVIAASKIRILLIDDHALFREGLVRLLEAEPDFAVVAQCASVEEALPFLVSQPVGVVLLDYDLGNEKGSEFFPKARESGFQGRTLILTAGAGNAEISHLIALGASGVFLKHDSPGLLSKCIRDVAEGRSWLDQSLIQNLLQQDRSLRNNRSKRFTEREQQVMRSILEGLSNKEIAARLSISESAVKSVVQQLFSKTGVRTRSQLVRIALEQYRGEF